MKLRATRLRSDGGSATVVAVAVLAVSIVAGVALAAAAGLLADRAKARAGADLAALSGAYAIREGLGGERTDACGAARTSATANRVTLTACTSFGDGSVQVTVASGRAKGTARAGPDGGEIQGPGGGSG